MLRGRCLIWAALCITGVYTMLGIRAVSLFESPAKQEQTFLEHRSPPSSVVATKQTVQLSRCSWTDHKRRDRRSSAPLITGDGFRAMASIVIDDDFFSRGDRAHLVLSCDRPNVSVFVQTHVVHKFASLVLPHLKGPINLITHNSDYSSPWESANTRLKHSRSEYIEQRHSILDSSKVSFWFAQNAAIKHHKIIPIPIGIENRYNKFGAFVESYLQRYRNAPAWGSRAKKVLVSFSVKTNPVERNAALSAVKKLPDRMVTYLKIKGMSSEKTLELFLDSMQKHAFVLAPHGHGLDTHRLWEALYMGCVPITLRSTMDPLLEQLPVLLVDSYDQITTDLLETFVPSGNREILEVNYWQQVINGERSS